MKLQPIVDARLKDGSRINAVIPPVAVDGSLLSIRKFAKIPFDLDRLVDNGAMTAEMQRVLEGIVKGKLNILISGGTARARRRCSTRCRSPSATRDHRHHRRRRRVAVAAANGARIETRPSNIEGKGEISQRELVSGAAYAARPDHRRRGSCRRSLRHVAGDEHRPRRLDDHDPREPARDALARSNR